MSLQDLREKRTTAAKALKDLVEKPDWHPATDEPIYNNALAEIDQLDAKIQRINAANEKIASDTRTEHVAAAADRKARDTNDPGLAIYAKWLRGGDKALSEQDWSDYRNTMSTTVPSEGGFTVPSVVAPSVLEALKAYGGMRAVATVIATSGAAEMSFPTSDGTGQEGEIVMENQAATEQDVTFGTIGLPVYKYSSKVVTVPIELLQDSAIDLEAFVRARQVQRLGRITNKHFTIGTGSAQPHGIVTAATVGVTAANGTSQVTAVTYDSLVDLQHSVDPAYREAGNTRFMLNDDSLKVVRKIRDGSQRPLFVPGYEQGNPGGAPDQLLGRPITINQQMANMAAGARSILFGDFSHYTIRDVMVVQMFRFADSAYLKKGQVGFLAWMRSGGNLIDVGGAVKAFVNATS
jgi:HK97 family phage major capsid protein